MEFGLFNSACVLPQFDGDEHRRIMDEVAIVQAADRVGFKYTWATEHHFLTEYSHLSANEVFLGYLAAATDAHPPRLGHLQHHAAGEPPGARRRAGRAARPPQRRPLRVRHGPRVVDDRAARVRHRRARSRRATCSTRSSASSAACGAPRSTRASTARSSRCRRATCCRSRTRSRTRRCGSRPGSPSTFQKAARMGLGVLCFTMGGAESVKPLIELYKKEIEHAEPVGDYVNDNVMVTTQLLCLEDGAARPRARRRARRWATRTACCSGTSTRSRGPRASRSGRTLIPEADAGRDRRSASATGDAAYGTPDEVAVALAEVRGRRRRPGRVRPAVVVDGRATSRSRSSRRSARHVLPQFDKDPVHRTTRQRQQQLA